MDLVFHVVLFSEMGVSGFVKLHSGYIKKKVPLTVIKMNVGSLIASVFSVFLLIPCHSGTLIS